MCREASLLAPRRKKTEEKINFLSFDKLHMFGGNNARTTANNRPHRSTHDTTKSSRRGKRETRAENIEEGYCC